MNILYLGDVMAEPGLLLLERKLPELRKSLQADVVIAQAENLSDGKGILPEDFKRLRKSGVDFATGGNHSLARPEIYPLLSDPAQPIIRPANYPNEAGLGYKYLATPKGSILVVSIMGQIVGRDAERMTDNPLLLIDQILAGSKERIATVVNFHGDFSSEKVVFGHYLDGRVSLVVGDHWHVPTADARVLPAHTGYITDVGMCGVLDSSLGVTYDSIIPRWRDGRQTRNMIADTPPFQLNGVLATIDEKTGLAKAVKQVQEVYER